MIDARISTGALQPAMQEANANRSAEPALSEIAGELLPLRMLVVTLEFIRDTELRFFHQVPVTALLRTLITKADGFEDFLRVDTPESSRVHYRAGDLYRFSVTGLSGSDALLRELVQGLRKLPLTQLEHGEKLRFGNNIVVRALQDGYSANSVDGVEQLTHYGSEDLQRECGHWKQQSVLECRLQAPARILKDKEQRKGRRGEARFCRDAADLDGCLFLTRVYDSIAELMRRRSLPAASRPVPPPAGIEIIRVFWLDTQYHDRDGKEKLMGGLCGMLRLQTGDSPLSDGWLRLLILGQYCGIGQRCAFGWGRYQLIDSGGQPTRARVFPATSLLIQAADAANLAAATRHIHSNIQSEADRQYPDGPDDAVGPDELDDDRLLPELRELLIALHERRYRVPPLHGVLIPKADGTRRALSIPPLRDRILQRAVSQILTTGIERIQYHGSYGFRPGRSRQGARATIQQAWRDGYCYVYESDIEDFFGSVDHERLRDRLQALYVNDPVIEAVCDWMAAPVRFEQQQIARERGLPQGSPLSPLMANLMLDDFDSDMQTAGFRLVRFADDFVILCKSAEEAERAHQAVTTSLREHGFELNRGKTRISQMEQGFYYLGYLFLNDLVLDAKYARYEEKRAGDIPRPSWLARLGEKTPRRLESEREAKSVIPRQRHAVTEIGEREDSGTSVIVSGQIATLNSHNQRLQIRRQDRLLHDLPWKDVERVILFGPHHMTTPALHAAMRRQCPVHYATGFGRYLGSTQGDSSPRWHTLWEQQLEQMSDRDACCKVAARIVAARIGHQRETLRQRGWRIPAELRSEAAPEPHRRYELPALNGIEGNATRAYFEVIRKELDEHWGFEGRNRQPPRDPFNVMLSLGYSLLHAYCDSLIRADGLYPYRGVYHQPHGSHAVLASDLMEPFRHIAERAALTLIARREIRCDDFQTDDHGRCIISDPASRTLIGRLVTRLETPVKGSPDQPGVTLLQQMHRQNQSMIEWIREGREFVPWRSR